VARRAFRSPEWRVLADLLVSRRQNLVEKLVLISSERDSTCVRAQVLLLDWLTDGRWEYEETAVLEPPETGTGRDYLARDIEEY
jgi:hypothetical protein